MKPNDYSNNMQSVCVETIEQRSKRAFTLPELLAAMLFVALVIPVALQGVMLANRAAVVAERKLTATRLAERVLQEMVITDTWQTNAKNGTFGEEWPNYRWEFVDQAWDQDTMQLITIMVYYQVQGLEQQVRLSTLVDLSEEPTEEEEA